MTDRKRPKVRGADAEPGDAELWRAVVEDVQPLRRRAPASPPAVAEKRKPAAPAGKTDKPAPARQVRPSVQPSPPAPPALPALAPGRAPGLDRRSAQRLTRGQMKIDATLDLHGMTQAEAAATLSEFLADAEASGRRCVLVITGKGRIGEETGVLRRMVPRWLNAPPNRARVLSFADAQPKHGGAGAMYVLLKRKR